MSTHTPGPWAYDPNSREVFANDPRNGCGWIALVGGNDSNDRPLPDSERLANARLIVAAPALLAEARALVVKLGGMAVHPSHYAGLVAAIVAATVVEAPHHPDCPATDGFGCHCDELGPWEHDPLPAVYADDYPLDEPPPLASESELAARDWAAGRFGG